MFKNQKPTIKIKVFNFLLSNNVLYNYLQMAVTLTIINRADLISTYTAQLTAAQVQLVLFLSALLLLRYFFSVSITPLFYGVFFRMLIDEQISAINIILGFQLLVLAVVHVCGSINFDFGGDSISGQDSNGCKVGHIVILSFGIVIQNKWDGPYTHAAAAVLFVLLFIARSRSLMKSYRLKQVYLRMYMWIICQHVKLALKSWTTLNADLAQLIGPLLVSQIIFAVLLVNLQKQSLQQLFSNQQYVKLSFRICEYIVSNRYDAGTQQQIDKILKVQDMLCHLERVRAIYGKVIGLLKDDKSFFSLMLQAQIYLQSGGQILKAKLIVYRLKLQSKFWQVMCNILIFRLQSALKQKFMRQNQLIKFSNYTQYYISQELKKLLLKSSIKYINFISYLSKSEIKAVQFKTITSKLVHLQNQIDSTYNSMKVKCLSVALLYVSYLFEVSLDFDKAGHILDRLQYSQTSNVVLNLDHKIFLRIGLIPEMLKIQKVGQNANLLLGYERKEIEGQSIQILLPQFYRPTHQSIICNVLQQNFQQIYLYRKKSLVKNNKGYYEECDMTFFLDLNLEGELTMVGYLYVRRNPNYDLSYFVFVNDSAEIVECSSNLNIRTTSAEPVKFTNYFKCINPSQQRYSLLQSNAQYHLLKTYEMSNNKVYFISQLIKQQTMVQIPLNNFLMSMQIQSQIQSHKQIQQQQLNKYKQEFMKGYAQRIIGVKDKMNHWEVKVLYGSIVVLIIGLFISVLSMIYGVTLKTNHLNYVVQSYDDMLNYYNNSFELGMKLNYIDLNYQYNYTNNFTSNDGIIMNALNIQQKNQHLKKFNGALHAVPSTIKNITYQKTNYQIIQQFVANSYLIQQFSNDHLHVLTILQRLRLNMQSIFIVSLLDYRLAFLSTISGFSTEDMFINKWSIILICCLVVLVSVLIVRLEVVVRNCQNSALGLVSTIQTSDQQIHKIKEFIARISLQQINFRHSVVQYQHTAQLKEKEDTRSQISLRQLSGRNLMEDTHNNSKITSIRITEQQIIQKRSIKIIPIGRNKYILIALFAVMSILLSLTLTNHLVNNILKDIDELVCTQSLVNLYKTSINYSRAVVNTLNVINLKPNSVQFDTRLFDGYMGGYVSSLKTIVIPSFAQSRLSQFTYFASAFSQFQFAFMCSYMSCSPQFKQQIDLVYTSTIQKMASNFISLKTTVKQTNKTNIPDLITNGTLKKQIDLMFYTEDIIRRWAVNLCFIYVNSFKMYIQNIKTSKMFFLQFANIDLICGSIAFICLMVFIHRQNRLLISICQLVKIKGYREIICDN